jgi:hypothetical protein
MRISEEREENGDELVTGSPSEITDHSRIPIMIPQRKNGKKIHVGILLHFRATREEKP